jgi:hypothetical protein
MRVGNQVPLTPSAPNGVRFGRRCQGAVPRRPGLVLLSQKVASEGIENHLLTAIPQEP